MCVAIYKSILYQLHRWLLIVYHFPFFVSLKKTFNSLNFGHVGIQGTTLLPRLSLLPCRSTNIYFVYIRISFFYIYPCVPVRTLEILIERNSICFSFCITKMCIAILYLYYIDYIFKKRYIVNQNYFSFTYTFFLYKKIEIN